MKPKGLRSPRVVSTGWSVRTCGRRGGPSVSPLPTPFPNSVTHRGCRPHGRGRSLCLWTPLGQLEQGDLCAPGHSRFGLGGRSLHPAALYGARRSGCSPWMPFP